MTYLELVNSVLKRMRFNTVGTVSQSTYSTLIGEFVNEAKREVEDAWDWVQLRDTIQITTSDGVFRYTLTGAGKRYRLLQDPAGRVDVFNDTEDVFLQKAPSMRWMSARLNDNDATNNQPSHFDINGQSSGDPQVDLYPIPDGVYTINFNMVIPQDDLSSDSTSLIVPDYPVLLGAWAKAMEDRGEDGGNSVASVYRRYHDALSDAISYDRDNAGPWEDMWMVT